MIGILGGTFDPIHYGHLAPAEQVQRAAGLDVVHFVPCAQPPHRAPTRADARHRLRMVELALEGRLGFVADDREIRMGGVSYTVRTLQSLRDELGEVPIALILGADAFLGLSSWFSWEDIPRLANLIVMDRPGWDLDAGVPPWAAGRMCADPAQLRRSTAGSVHRVSITPVDISSTRIRDAVARGESIDALVPPRVRDYIEQFGLYRHTRARQGVV
jgi:nicotinate-nucleotide adenylyltransferase